MLDKVLRPLIDNRYRPMSLLGRGGMSEVYLARDEVLRRDVALKILAERYSDDEESVERFRREAQNSAALSHPNIVPVYDLGETAEGAHYLVMEYVPGGTLTERILREGPLDVRTAAWISYQVAEALGTAHDGGVIHRDVKPQNILFAASGEVKVADFGIAWAASSYRLTQTGFSVGTADYMSPEQAMGEPVGPESDLYSLGVVLYQMLTGELPFKADSPLATAVKHANEPPPKLRRPEVGDSAFPQGLEVVVDKLLVKNRTNRYGKASSLMVDLERVMNGLSLTGPAKVRIGAPSSIADDAVDPTKDTVVGPAARRTRGRRSRRGRYLTGAGLAGALLLGAASALGYSGSGSGGLPWNLSAADGPQAGLSSILGKDNAEVGSNDPAQAALPARVANPDEASSGSGAQESSGSAFVQRATPDNISRNSTYIDDSRTNGRLDAILSVTQSWNPEGEGGTYNDHPVGVWYDAGAEQWAIFNQDRAAMPEGAAFNVTVS